MDKIFVKSNNLDTNDQILDLLLKGTITTLRTIFKEKDICNEFINVFAETLKDVNNEFDSCFAQPFNDINNKLEADIEETENSNFDFLIIKGHD